MSKSKFHRVYRRWHRRTGILSAFFVLFLSITGILLNHTSMLGLGSKHVESPFLLKFYGIKPPVLQSYQIKRHDSDVWLSALGRHTFINAKKIHQCEALFVGIAVLSDSVAMACETELVLFDASFAILDIITPAFGLPESINAVGVCGDNVCINTISGRFQLDVETLAWKATKDVMLEYAPDFAPESVRHTIAAHYTGANLMWERVVLDVHAGRFMGELGPWVMDLMALLFIVLALTGVYLWLKGGGKKERRAKG